MTAAQRSAYAGAALGSVPSPWYQLGDLEREIAAEILAREEGEAEHWPREKTISGIRVFTLEVFDAEDIYPLWLNALHVRTREDVLRDRLTFEVGDAYSPLKISESRRLLLDPLRFTTVMVLPVRVPTEAGQAERVELWVITKDLWSLRLNSMLQTTGSSLDYLALSVSENNFFGRNKLLALSFLLEPDTFALGPTYYDPAIWGSHHQFNEVAKLSFNRDSGAFEGGWGWFELGLPIFGIDSHWGWSAALSVRHLIERQYSGGEQLRYPLEAPPGEESIPWSWRDRYFQGEAFVTRSMGQRFKHDLSLGWRGRWRRPEVVEAGSASPALMEAFRADYLPLDRQESAAVLRFEDYDMAHESFINLDLLGLAEELQMGHRLRIEAELGQPLLGAEHSYFLPSVELSYRARPFDEDMAYGALFFSARHAQSQWGAYGLGFEGRYASPPLLWGRLHAALLLSTSAEDPDPSTISLGGDNGLRGWPSGYFLGRHWLRANLEWRSQPVKVFWGLRMGGVLYWDSGSAWSGDYFEGLELNHGVGMGLRWSMPQFNRVVTRLDWAFPMNGAGSFPGRVNFGFEQAF